MKNKEQFEKDLLDISDDLRTIKIDVNKKDVISILMGIVPEPDSYEVIKKLNVAVFLNNSGRIPNEKFVSWLIPHLKLLSLEKLYQLYQYVSLTSNSHVVAPEYSREN